VPPNSDYFHFDGSSNASKLMIVFGYINQPVGVLSHLKFLESADCKKVFLNPGCNLWYQTGVPGLADSLETLEIALKAICREYDDHDVLCLGHSMGAYAALYFAARLGASRVLASVPELQLNVPGSISINHMNGRSGPNLLDVLPPDIETGISVIVGTKNQFDLDMADRLTRFPGVQLWKIPCSHETFPYLRDSGRLKEILEAFVRDGDIAPHISDLVDPDFHSGVSAKPQSRGESRPDDEDKELSNAASLQRRDAGSLRDAVASLATS
jgi:pimeloyl-ACP methyl ester carboxylesterase